MVENMDDYDANACMSAFSKFCDEAERNELVSNEDYQYWVFERGYRAAMLEVAKVMQLSQSGRSVDLNLQLTANRAAYQ
jgi:hypothetical protein